MEIVWLINETGRDTDLHGFEYNYTSIHFRVHADGYDDALQYLMLEEWGDEATWPTVIRSTQEEYITGVVLDSMCRMLEHFGAERYQDMPSGWHKVYIP